MKRLAGLLLACLGALPVGAAEPARQGQSAPPATGTVTLVCEAVYMPTRATWARTVTVAFHGHYSRFADMVAGG